MNGLLEVLTLQAADHLLFVHVLLRQSELDGLAEDVIVVVDVHDEVRSMLLGELHVFFIGKAGVLDGVDAGEDGATDAFGAVGVGGDFASGGVRFVGRGL